VAERAAAEPFVWRTRVFFDDLDPMGLVHNSRYAVLIERAEASFNLSQGRRWELDLSLNPDQFYAIKEQTFRFMAPIRGCVDIEVHMWLDRMGRTSVTWGFEVRSSSGLHAVASRTIVRLEPTTYRPSPWSDQIRVAYAAIAREANGAQADADVST
jgi:acyl-CoA thioester hydrolase